jgi:hypothetical protein
MSICDGHRPPLQEEHLASARSIPIKVDVVHLWVQIVNCHYRIPTAAKVGGRLPSAATTARRGGFRQKAAESPCPWRFGGNFGAALFIGSMKQGPVHIGPVISENHKYPKNHPQKVLQTLEIKKPKNMKCTPSVHSAHFRLSNGRGQCYVCPVFRRQVI